MFYAAKRSQASTIPSWTVIDPFFQRDYHDYLSTRMRDVISEVKNKELQAL
jgi:hypothetical protein